MNVHPFAAAAPILEADDLAALAEDIAANGLHRPLTRWTSPDGEQMLLDGRNRLAACKIAKVEPTWIDYDGDPIAYVISANVHRRHLSTGQRAMWTAVGLAEQGARTVDASGNGRWKRGTVPVDDREIPNSTWRDAVTNAGTVLDHAPDLVAGVLAGSTKLDAAYKVAIDRRAQEVGEEVRRDRLRADWPDLYAMVVDVKSQLTLAEAEAVARERSAELRKIRGAAADAAERLVADARSAAASIVGGIEAGQTGLVTEEMIDDLEQVVGILRSNYDKERDA